MLLSMTARAGRGAWLRAWLRAGRGAGSREAGWSSRHSRLSINITAWWAGKPDWRLNRQTVFSSEEVALSTNNPGEKADREVVTIDKENYDYSFRMQKEKWLASSFSLSQLLDNVYTINCMARNVIQYLHPLPKSALEMITEFPPVLLVNIKTDFGLFY